MKKLSGSSNIDRGGKECKGVTHNIYHGGHIETDHHVILSMLEDVAKQFTLHRFTDPVPGTRR